MVYMYDNGTDKMMSEMSVGRQKHNSVFMMADSGARVLQRK